MQTDLELATLRASNQQLRGALTGCLRELRAWMPDNASDPKAKAVKAQARALLTRKGEQNT